MVANANNGNDDNGGYNNGGKGTPMNGGINLANGGCSDPSGKGSMQYNFGKGGREYYGKGSKGNNEQQYKWCVSCGSQNPIGYWRCNMCSSPLPYVQKTYGNTGGYTNNGGNAGYANNGGSANNDGYAGNANNGGNAGNGGNGNNGGYANSGGIGKAGYEGGNNGGYAGDNVGNTNTSDAKPYALDPNRFSEEQT